MGGSSQRGQGSGPRLTQEEKSAETRRRLLDAAINCLVERGYANTTTSEIADRAGLSRGAQLYHFPKKEELLTSAVEHLFELMFGEMKEQVGRLISQSDRRVLAIDSLWEMGRGRLAIAWIELVVASRTDPYLREAVTAANERMAGFLDQSFKELFPPPANADPDYDLIPQIAILIVDAMCLQGSTMKPQMSKRILDLLKSYRF